MLKSVFDCSVSMGLYLGVLLSLLCCIQYADAEEFPEFKIGETIYENPLASPEDVQDWVAECDYEGRPIITSSPKNEGMLRLYSDHHHFLLWCPKDFPDNIAVSWDFQPIAKVDERGLAMFWFAATGKDGKDLFDPDLQERDGDYNDYRKGDINALHAAYFRRNRGESPFQVISMRKSMVDNNGPRVIMAPDPLPAPRYADNPYRIQVVKHGPYVRFSINGLKIFEWKDTGEHGAVLEGGKIGFRQMRGLIADYANLKVHRVKIKKQD